MPDYAGCYHLYEGALIAVRPLLANHADLQKAIDDGLDDARNTPDTTKRAFVLRAVIDQVRGALKPGGPTVAPPAETLWERLGGEAGVSGVVDTFKRGKIRVNYAAEKEYKPDGNGATTGRKRLSWSPKTPVLRPFRRQGRQGDEDVHKAHGHHRRGHGRRRQGRRRKRPRAQGVVDAD